MLKKSLHFFIRCTISIILITAFLTLDSCSDKPEDYLSFLDGSQNFTVTLCRNDKEIAVLRINTHSGTANGDTVTLRFEAPKALSGTIVTYSAESTSFVYEGIALSDTAVPELWRRIPYMLSKDKTVKSVSTADGITVIIADGENGEVEYRLDGKGYLVEISCSDTVLKIQKEETGDR